MTSADTSFLAERADGTLAYKATESGHLSRMFEILEMYPEVALRVTSLTLDEVFDGTHHSDIHGFAEDYDIEPGMGPLDEGAKGGTGSPDRRTGDLHRTVVCGAMLTFIQLHE
jgi:hypothetical protein